MKLAIRPAIDEDLPLITRLLAEMDGAAPLPPARAAAIFREMARYPFHRCYLAFDGDEPVGTFSLVVFPTLVHDGKREALVDGVVVTAARRGEGIGAAMMREAMRLAAEAGCYKLALSSNAKRADAHRFYEALGFTRHGVSFSIDPTHGRGVTGKRG
jgi:GNAT superfamily N-acetyltransferase